MSRPVVTVDVSRRAAVRLGAGAVLAALVAGCTRVVGGRAAAGPGVAGAVTGTWTLAITDLGASDADPSARPGTLEITPTTWRAWTANAPATQAEPDEWSGTWSMTAAGVSVAVDQLDTPPEDPLTVTPSEADTPVVPTDPEEETLVVLGTVSEGPSPTSVLRVRLDTARSFTVTYEESGVPVLRFAGTRT